jgi:glutaredoxin 3
VELLDYKKGNDNMITIYGHGRCGWCIRAKKLAERYSLSYEWKDTDDNAILNEMKIKLPEARTVPQIWWHEKYIGGYEDFAAEVENTIGGYGDQRF